MALNLSKTVVEILKSNPNKYYTARELAEEVLKMKPKECHNKMDRSKATVVPINDENSLINQLVAEIGAYKKRIFALSDKIKITTERPRKYYYSEKTDFQEIYDVENNLFYRQENNGVIKKNEEAEKLRTNRHPEHDSYPLLCQYLYNELNIYPKRIDEKKSCNSKGRDGNKWLHPDIVGLKICQKIGVRRLYHVRKNMLLTKPLCGHLK